MHRLLSAEPYQETCLFPTHRARQYRRKLKAGTYVLRSAYTQACLLYFTTTLCEGSACLIPPNQATHADARKLHLNRDLHPRTPALPISLSSPFYGYRRRSPTIVWPLVGARLHFLPGDRRPRPHMQKRYRDRETREFAGHEEKVPASP